MHTVEASATDVDKPQDEETNFDKPSVIDEVLLTTAEAMAELGAVEENGEGADSREDGAKGGTAEEDVNNGNMEDKVTDLNDVDMDATDSEKAASTMSTSLGDFTLSDMLSAVGRKCVRGRGTKPRACKL